MAKIDLLDKRLFMLILARTLKKIQLLLAKLSRNSHISEQK
jgi:hypothetical protein